MDKINNNFIFMCCDIQGAISNYIKDYASLLEHSCNIVKLSKNSNNPIIFAEGNTKTFGHTEPSLFKSIDLQNGEVFDGFSDG